MKPVLLGPDGQPIDRTRLLVEQAAPSFTSVRQIASCHPADGLTPQRLGHLLREAEIGDARAYLELAEQMEEKDLHYLGVLGKRKRAVTQLEITVIDASKSASDRAAGDLVRDFINRDELQAEMFDILDATGKGYSVTEILWDTSEGQWMPKRLKWRDPRWFRHSISDGETLEMWDNAGFLPLAPYQFISHVVQAKSGLPIRGGLARAVAWSYLFKNYDIKSWVIFAEAYGHPLRVGKYGPGATNEDKKALLSAVRNIGADAGAIIPDSMLLEFIESKMAGNVELFEKMADWFDKQVSKAVLGNTGTTDAIAGGHAVGKVHRQVEEDIERSDAVLLGTTLNRDLVRPIVDLNMGPQRKYPRIRIVVEDEEDYVQFANAISLLVDAGLEVAQDDVRQRIGVRTPEPGEKILTKVTNAAGQPAPLPMPSLSSALAPDNLSVHAQNAAVDEADSIDALIEEQLADWKPLIQPMLSPIAALAKNCTSAEDFLAKLPSVIPAMKVDAFASALAKAMFSARLAGETAADLGSGAHDGV